MPKLDGILETAIHTEDMLRARAFYEGVLGLEPIYSDNRLSAYEVAGRDAVGKDELDRWEAHLASRGVAIEGRNDWSRGGRSIYFRDPDGHLLELATSGLWSVY